MAAKNPDDVRMSLGEHLEELRYRLFMGLIGPVIFAIALMFVAAGYVIPFLCKPLLMALEANGQSANLYIPGVGDAFGVYLKVSLIGGLILGIPWLGYHLWLFVAPALYSHERKYIVWMVPGSGALATLGVAFMYYVMLPFTLWFLIGFAANFPLPAMQPGWVDAMLRTERPAVTSDPALPPLKLPTLDTDPAELAEGALWIKVPENQLRVVLDGKVRKIPLESTSLVTPQLHFREYISFVMMMSLAFAVAFQLPLVMLAIGFIGIADHVQMRKAWRIALMVCFIVGAVLTPADPLSMFALALPLYGLYEFGLVLMRMVAKGKQSEAATPEA